MKKSILSFSGILFLSLLFSIELPAQPIYHLTGVLSGANEVPQNASAGTGYIQGTYNENTNEINISVPFSGLSGPAISAHIHNAPAGANGDIIVTLTIPASTSGTATGNAILSNMEEAELFANNMYVNIHTSMYMGGEIRSQIYLAPTVPTLGQWALIFTGLILLCVGTVVIRNRIGKAVVE